MYYVLYPHPIYFICRKTTDGNEISIDNIENINDEHYEMTTNNVIQRFRVSSLYQTLLKPEINIFTTSNVTLDTLLSEGNFFQTWKGKLTENKSDPLHVVIKKTKGDYEISDNYLKSQGLHLTKLRSNDYIIACLGMTSDLTLLIMEDASLGNLRNYLETKANETYYNMTSVKTSEIIFINQIIEGVNAVHNLGLPGLFYCLCSSNVLLSSDQKCKLSGFASDESVRAREKWEEENNVRTN
ncbi:hypothetical protein LSH36_2002g00016 [Paralvinella palmiformis]|uniref:Protein kinase domain-containing protein n=1 Tax=Paralvinella palmiformis TaxID=53620 RepID=A0AAD9IR71_9ANNE|nr:hypothetical protein LSH36_2002g00016 [Paralvinella palmiformis]